ncbi:MAG: murein hydrolase activator EnvC family protein [Candidatus Dormibacteria bacterium]
MLAVAGLAGLEATGALAAGAPPAAPTLVAVTPGASSVQQQQAQLDALAREKQSLNDQLARGQGERDSLTQLIQTNQQSLAATQAEIQKSEADLAQARSDQAATEKRLAAEQSEFARYVRATYLHQDDLVSFMVSATSLADLVDRVTMAGEVNRYGARVVTGLRQDDAHLQQVQRDLATRQVALRGAQVELQREIARDNDLRSQLDQAVAQLQWAIAVADAQTTAELDALTALQVKQLDDVIAQVDQAAWDSARLWMDHNLVVWPSGDTAHSTGSPLIWPVAGGTITQWFGPSPYAMEPPAYGYPHFHTGIDIAAPQGTPILAADDGVVVAAEDSLSNGQLVGYGRHVILLHRNGAMTLYGHMLAYGVKPGDVVRQGDLIGLVGSTGNSTGPHLHFELRAPVAAGDQRSGASTSDGGAPPAPLQPVDPKAYLPLSGSGIPDGVNG